jgi:hypothetical protein
MRSCTEAVDTDNPCERNFTRQEGQWRQMEAFRRQNQSKLCKLAEDAVLVKNKVTMPVAAGRGCSRDNQQGRRYETYLAPRNAWYHDSCAVTAFLVEE